MDRAEVQEWLVALKADTTKAKDALAAIASESESAEDILRHDKGHDDWHASHGDPPCKSEEDCSAMSAKYKNEEATKGGPGSGPHKGGGKALTPSERARRADYHEAKAKHYLSIANSIDAQIRDAQKSGKTPLHELLVARDANQHAYDCHTEIPFDYRSTSPRDNESAENNANKYAKPASAAADEINNKMFFTKSLAKDIANLKEAPMSKLQDAQEWLAAIKADAAKANSIFSKEWEESKHPRGAGGKFGSGSGSGGDAGGSTKTPDRPKLDGQFETGAHDYATNNTILTALNDKATYDKTRDTQTPEETRAAVASASPSNGLSRTDLGATNWGEVHEAVLQSRED